MTQLINSIFMIIIVNLLSIPLLSYSYVLNKSNKLDHGEILRTVQQEDMGRLEWLLNEGVNPDYFDNTGDKWTALMHAVNKRSFDFVDRLLRARANVNQLERDGWTALHFAAAYGHIAIARLLIEAGADVTIKNNVGLTPIDVAKQNKKIEILEILESAKLNKLSPKTLEQIYLSNIEAQQQILSITNTNINKALVNDEILLFTLSEKGPNEELIKLLNKKIININIKSPGDGRTALHRASFSGNIDRMKLLIDNGAYINDLDSQNWTPLMFAAANVY